MNSDTATRYGSRVRRHGRSRAARAYQARSLRVKAWGMDLRAMATQHTADATRGPMADVTAVLDLRRLVGRWSLRAAGHTGRFTFFVADMFRRLGEWRTWLPRTFEQAISIGYRSLFLVLLIPGFAGGVTARPTGYPFTGAYPLYIAGGVISES